jgi:hypothetical protein
MLQALWPVFRYSYGRQAYVLRGVGRRFGPVLVERRRAGRRRPAGDVANTGGRR